MNFQVYIIYSPSTDTFYVGQTADLNLRLEQHNQGFFHNANTSKVNDWEIFHTIHCNSRRQALLIEKHIKRMKKREYYHNLKKYPEIQAKLIVKYHD